MSITLKDVGGFWLDSPFGGEGVRFKLRDMDPVEEGRFTQTCTTYRFVKKDDGTESRVEYVDQERKAWLGFNYIVVDWEGIDIEMEEDGQKVVKALPCTEENKRRLFVQRGLGIQTLLLEYAKIKAEEFKSERTMLKNSDASSNSDTISPKSTVPPANVGK